MPIVSRITKGSKYLIVSDNSIARELKHDIELSDNNSCVILQSTNELHPYLNQNYQVLVCLGNNEHRKDTIKLVKDLGFDTPFYISSSSTVFDKSKIGEATIIYPNCWVGYKTKVGSNNMIRPFTYIAHDCKVGNNNYFSPKSSLAGSCVIGSDCFLGIASVLKPNIHLKDQTKLGAGAVVTKNFKANVTLIGVPAKVML